MKRRDFLKGAVVVGVSAPVVAKAVSEAPNTDLKMYDSTLVPVDTIHQTGEFLNHQDIAKRVRDKFAIGDDGNVVVTGNQSEAALTIESYVESLKI